MWHEARKSEKKVLGVMVDMQKRAERRRAYYEKLGEDPFQLLRLTGTGCKIHLEPSVSMAAESSSVMVPLRCDANVLIDRWDVRASMDIIPKYKSDPASLPEMDFSEQQCNYERYRVLIQNQCRKVDEEAYLQRIDLEELYPKKSIATRKAEKKKLAAQKAAIGYKYEENTVPSAQQEAAAAELARLIGKTDEISSGAAGSAPPADGGGGGGDGGDSSDEDGVLRDRDPPINIDPGKPTQNAELNRIGLSFGLSNFTSMVTSEVMEAKVVKEAEEKGNALAAISSRASRQNRSKRIELRKEKDQLLMSRPSYAQRASPTYEEFRPDGSDSSDSSHSASRSPSPSIEIISGFSTGSGAALKSTALPSSAGAAGVSSSSRRHGEAKSWQSTASSSSAHQHRRHSSPDSSRHHTSSSRSHHSRSPSRHTGGNSTSTSSRYIDHHSSRSRHHDSHDRSDRSHRSRSRSYERHRHHRDSRSPRRGGSGTYDDHRSSHYRSRSRSRSRSPGRDYRRHSPDRSSAATKSQTDTGALAAAKKLIQSKGTEKLKLTPQERLKLKMQLQLARTQKTDRAKVASKAEKEESERQERMDELVERSRKHREKERQRRYDDDSRRSGGRSPSPYDYDYDHEQSSHYGSSTSSRYY